MINKKPEMEALGLDKINACLENKKRVERNWLKFILVLTKLLTISIPSQISYAKLFWYIGIVFVLLPSFVLSLAKMFFHIFTLRLPFSIIDPVSF